MPRQARKESGTGIVVVHDYWFKIHGSRLMVKGEWFRVHGEETLKAVNNPSVCRKNCIFAN